MQCIIFDLILAWKKQLFSNMFPVGDELTETKL